MNGFIKDNLGFIRCNVRTKTCLNNNELTIETMTEKELEKENAMMLESGFVPNQGFDCYIVHGYGAWMGNINTINDFNEHYSFLIDKGYNILLKPAKYNNGTVYFQVFCENYLIIFAELMKKKIEREKRLVLKDN